MEVITIERSTYEELLTSFNSFVTKMKAMASRGNDKGLGDWLDNRTSVQEHYRLYGITGRWPILKSTARCTINLRMWRVFFMLWQVEIRKARCVIPKRAAYERIDNAA